MQRHANEGAKRFGKFNADHTKMFRDACGVKRSNHPAGFNLALASRRSNGHATTPWRCVLILRAAGHTAIGVLPIGRLIVHSHEEGFALSGDSLLIILVVGVVAGWLAGQILRGTGFGLVADLCIGIIGAFIGNWILPKLGIHLGAHLLSQIISATIGAIVLLLILGLFRRRY